MQSQIDGSNPQDVALSGAIGDVIVFSTLQNMLNYTALNVNIFTALTLEKRTKFSYKAWHLEICRLPCEVSRKFNPLEKALEAVSRPIFTREQSILRSQASQLAFPRVNAEMAP